MMHIALKPKHNDWYEELCALAAIGELSSSEFDEFRAHLVECPQCRELHADFRRIAADDLGFVAVSKKEKVLSENTCEQTDTRETSDIDEHALLGRLLHRARKQGASQPARPRSGEPLGQTTWARRSRRVVTWLRQPFLSYGSVGLLVLVLAATGAYRLKEAEVSPTLSRLSSEVEDWKGKSVVTTAEKQRASMLLAEMRRERDALRKSLDELQTDYGQLQAKKESLVEQVALEHARQTQDELELHSAKTDGETKSKEIAALEARMRDISGRAEEEKKKAERLQARLDRLNEEQVAAAAATPEAQGFGDVEAKELFGARDLHIVDVYDVDAKGTTKRTYGRVYYVEKRLLMFYAFDLDTKRRNGGPSSFQAWGYQQATTTKAESLGLFSMDDPSLNRWVLKVNNPRVLERVDAVFVTAEVPHGSASPTGRRLLYANLAGPANHP